MSKYKQQRRNANKHSDQGTRLLGESIQRDGFIGAITVAADGESFDGSNRLKVGAEQFENAIEIHTRGQPVVVVRDDIPSADDPKAKRLGVLANQITSSDWNPDAAILAEIAKDDDVIAAVTREDARLAELIRGPIQFNQSDLVESFTKAITEGSGKSAVTFIFTAEQGELVNSIIQRDGKQKCTERVYSLFAEMKASA